MKYYGVYIGRKKGVFVSWLKTKPHVEDFPGACYAAFALPSEAQYFADNGVAKSIQSAVPSSASSSSVVAKKDKSQIPVPAPAPAKILDNLVRTYLLKFEDAGVARDVLYVYTDGSTKNNGKRNATGGYGVFFSDPELSPISVKLQGKVTNNIAELSALVAAFKVILQCRDHYSDVIVYTDSEYSHLALTERYKKWELNGWVSVWKGKTEPIKNQDLIKTAYGLYQKSDVTLKHVMAHTGKTDLHSIGNEIADELAGGA